MKNDLFMISPLAWNTVASAYFLLGGAPQEDVEVSLAYSYLCQIKVVSKVNWKGW